MKKIKKQGDGQTPVERLVNVLKEVWPTDDPIDSIAIAAPGYLEPEEGLVVTAPNIPGWVNLPLAQILRDSSMFSYLGNDANLAAMGEWKSRRR